MNTYLARNGVTVPSETQKLSEHKRIKFESEATGAAFDLSHDHTAGSQDEQR